MLTRGSPQVLALWTLHGAAPYVAAGFFRVRGQEWVLTRWESVFCNLLKSDTPSSLLRMLFTRSEWQSLARTHSEGITQGWKCNRRDLQWYLSKLQDAFVSPGDRALVSVQWWQVPHWRTGYSALHFNETLKPYGLSGKECYNRLAMLVLGVCKKKGSLHPQNDWSHSNSIQSSFPRPNVYDSFSMALLRGSDEWLKTHISDSRVWRCFDWMAWLELRQ